MTFGISKQIIEAFEVIFKESWQFCVRMEVDHEGVQYIIQISNYFIDRLACLSYSANKKNR
jgi:hypothetical protein